jgi:hypothetical protein
MFEDLKREDIVWLAGFYEGEGCLSIRYMETKTQAVAKIVSTDKDVLEKCIKIFPLFILKSQPRAQENYKDQWTITVRRGDHINTFCSMIYPFLGQRRQEKIREFFDLYRVDRIKRAAKYDKGQKCKSCGEVLKPYSSARGYCKSCYSKELKNVFRMWDA